MNKRQIWVVEEVVKKIDTKIIDAFTSSSDITLDDDLWKNMTHDEIVLVGRANTQLYNAHKNFERIINSVSKRRKES